MRPARLDPGLAEIPPGAIAAVVTTLEMRRRAPGRGTDPARHRLERQRAMPVRHYRDLFRRVGADWLWFSRLAMDDAALAAIIHDPRVEVWAVLDRGNAQGLLELDFRTPGQCELAFFGLAPPLLGTGAGRWLMDRALERAWAHPITRVWVHTCTLDHPAALPFYLRSGFTAVHRQVEVAEDPRLSGLLPRDAAPHIPIVAPR